MSVNPDSHAEQLYTRFSLDPAAVKFAHGELTLTLDSARLLDVMRALRDEPEFRYEMLVDLAGVDYLEYGVGEWTTEDATREGFSRGVEKASFARFTFDDPHPPVRHEGPRFGVAYHLLSISRNARLRVKVLCAEDEFPVVASVSGIWAGANWYEREAFDMYGIMFEGHPDLRRLLTDYGFIGHPFRKDFPLIGHVEMRYDPEQGRVIYQPVTIEPRVLVPKTIREDHRYLHDVADKK